MAAKSARSNRSERTRHQVTDETFVVLSVFRYYPEASSAALYGIDKSPYWDIFDVTLLTRQRSKVKYVLLGGQKQLPSPGSTVVLHKTREVVDENTLDLEVVTLIEELELVQKENVNIQDLADVPWHSSMTDRLRQNVPIASKRPYFMDNWTFHVAVNREDTVNVKYVNIDDINMNEVYPLHDVVNKKVSQYAKPSVLVRVVRKSRLIHYINFLKEDKWPFQLPLMVADQTGWCAAVLWNKLGYQYFNRINEGDVLLLRNFRVKSGFQQKLKTFFPPPIGATLLSAELGLDEHNPVTEMSVVRGDVTGLPNLEFCLLSRRDLIAVPDFSIVDIAGVVTYVGRVEREARKVSQSGKIDWGGFFYRRWIHLKDNSSVMPLVVLVYGGDQVDVFHGLTPGQTLLCRHMLTNQQLSTITDSRTPRHGWLTTTTNSWIYIYDPSSPDNIPEFFAPALPSILPVHTRQGVRGGVFRYPPFQTTLANMKKWDQGLAELVVPSCDWSNVFGHMTWRECRQMVVHASLQEFKMIRLDFHKKGQLPAKRARLHEESSDNRSSDTTNDTSTIEESETIRDLGTCEQEDIAQLWPDFYQARGLTVTVATMKWRGLNEPITLHTVKPCAIKETVEVDSCIDFLRGHYDCYLGLVSADRFDLHRGERSRLDNSAEDLVGQKFVLVLDVYSAETGQPLINVCRAFQT